MITFDLEAGKMFIRVTIRETDGHIRGTWNGEENWPAGVGKMAKDGVKWLSPGLSSWWHEINKMTGH